MIFLPKRPNKRHAGKFLFIIFLFVFYKLAFSSEISEISEYSQYDLENENISKRPEGATSIPIKKKLFESFRKEVTVDKYYTKDGKKVKVILVRKNRPAFSFFTKWRNKKKRKNEAKKRYKMNRAKKTKKPNILRRVFKRKKKDDKSKEDSKTSDVNHAKENEESFSKNDVFEEDEPRTKEPDTLLDNTAPSSSGTSSYERSSIAGENTGPTEMKTSTFEMTAL
ncbi:hypothetical protein CmeUKMEL1_14540 [Cryptosporidium meleagridis]|uniref:Uncharacterized protein n=1 Tax=Cryptosporidium meleagridis TaxID=93969 RepID=A0A2P4Z455_9CRYT|nr:hypothetical protein CmeUKMEL1_14540 [Cryptosporidium meleagridis]